ncbi:MAG: kelch repeat-containing protein [Myxococcaceae bacterium]
MLRRVLVGLTAVAVVVVACQGTPEPVAATEGVPARSREDLWSQGPSMATGRSQFSTTLLLNGKVLITGGLDDAGTELNSVELYDPVTRQFTTLPPMAAPHSAHTASMLHDGRVLIVGKGGPAEILTLLPDGGASFTSALFPNAAHQWHTATVLDDGRVMIVGGDPTGKACDRFALDAGWQPCAPTNEPHRGAAATIVNLPGGGRQLMVVGGGPASDGGHDVVEFYDAVNDQWTTGGSFNALNSTNANDVLRYPTVFQLADGGVAVVGGTVNNNAETIWSYDLTRAAPYAIPKPWKMPDYCEASRGQVIQEPSGHLTRITGGSFDLNCGFDWTDARIFDLDLTQGPTLVTTQYATPGWAPTNREYQGAVLLPTGEIVVLGGMARNGSISSACLATQQTWGDAWWFDAMQGRDSFTALPSLPAPGWAHHTMTLLATGQVLLAGGDPGSGSIGGTTILSGSTWAPDAGPTLTTARSRHTATLLTDGRVLLAGGLDSAATTATAELYDPVTNQVTATASPLNAARQDHAAISLPDGRVLLIGGRDASGTALDSGEVFDPATGTFRLLPGLLPAPRYGLAVVSLADGRLFVIGGAQALNSAPLKGVFIDPVTLVASATQTTNMSIAHVFPGVVVVGNQVYVVDGTDAAGTVLSVADVYDVTAGSWSNLMLGAAQAGVSVTRLLNDRLLSLGGTGSAQVLIDTKQATRFAAAGSNGIHNFATAAVVPDGRVLVVGGAGLPSSIELYEEGRTPTAAWRPTLTSPGTVVAGARVRLVGAGLTGRVEGSGGGTLSSPTNYPFVTFESPGGDRVQLAVAAWTATSVDVDVPAVLIGQGWLRVTVGAIASVAVPVRVLRSMGASCALGSDCVGAVACAGTPTICTMPVVDGGTGGGGGTTGGGGGTTGGGGGTTGGGGGTTGGGGGSTGGGGGSTGGGAGTGGGGSTGGGSAAGGGGAMGGGGGTTGGGSATGGGSESDGGTGGGGGVALMSCGCEAGGASGGWLAFLVLGLIATRARDRRAWRVAGVVAVLLAPTLARAGERVAMLPLRALNGAKADLARVFTVQLGHEIATRGFKVMTPDDIEALLGVERQRQVLNCADAQCNAEIANALGSRFVISGSIANVGTTVVVELSRIDSSSGGVDQRFSQRLKNATEESILDVIAPAVAALFPGSAGVSGTGPGATTSTSGTDDASMRRFGVDARAQGVAPILSNDFRGNFGVLVTYRVLGFLELGAAALISTTPGGAVHAGLVIGSADWVVHPLVVLEVPLLAAAGSVAVGLTGALGIEWKPVPLLAVRAEVPTMYFFTPDTNPRFFLLGSVSVGVRL